MAFEGAEHTSLSEGLVAATFLWIGSKRLVAVIAATLFFCELPDATIVIPPLWMYLLFNYVAFVWTSHSLRAFILDLSDV